MGILMSIILTILGLFSTIMGGIFLSTLFILTYILYLSSPAVVHDSGGTGTSTSANEVGESFSDTIKPDWRASAKSPKIEERAYLRATFPGPGSSTGIDVNNKATESASYTIKSSLRASARSPKIEERTYLHTKSSSSNDTIKFNSPACDEPPKIEERTDLLAAFPSPSSITDRIQNVYILSALHATSAIQGLVLPKLSPPDFWEMAKKYENILQDYVPRLLRDAAATTKSTKFTDVMSAMQNIIGATATFRDRIQGALDAHHVTLDALTEELERIFMPIVHKLQNNSSPDTTPGHAERAEMVDKVLDDATLALIDLAHRYGINEEIVTTYLTALRPQVQALTVAIGDINEKHPKLFSVVAFSVATLLIPESWILRPLLSLFGFGPSGPVKGLAAPWLQRHFWGGAVEAGSWFSLLQAAGMGKLPKWAGLATKVPMLIGAILARQ